MINSGSAFGSEQGRGIVTDDDGNIYVTGSFQELVIDTVTLVTAGMFEMFLIKLNDQGSLQWAKQSINIPYGGTEGESLTMGIMMLNAVHKKKKKLNVYIHRTTHVTDEEKPKRLQLRFLHP